MTFRSGGNRQCMYSGYYAHPGSDGIFNRCARLTSIPKKLAILLHRDLPGRAIKTGPIWLAAKKTELTWIGWRRISVRNMIEFVLLFFVGGGVDFKGCPA